MALDPSDYDVAELRTGRASSDDTGAEAIVRSKQYRELAERDALAECSDRPYLQRVPETYSAELLVFDWLEYLQAKAGFRGALEAIRLYHSLGWLAADVEEQLDEYLRSFEADGSTAGRLGPGDHRRSLVYIARLAGAGD